MPPDRSIAAFVHTSPTSPRCPVFPAGRPIRQTGPFPCGPSRMRSKPPCERRRSPAEQPWKSRAFDAARPRLAFIPFSCAVSMRGRLSFTNVRLASIRGPSIIRKRSLAGVSRDKNLMATTMNIQLGQHSGRRKRMFAYQVISNKNKAAAKTLLKIHYAWFSSLLFRSSWLTM